MSKVIGIDLGTGNLCLSVFEAGHPTVIVNNEGDRTTPSMVGFGDDGQRKFGRAAKRQAITNPKKTVYSIKRFMGQSFDQIKDEANRVTYDVVNDGGYPKVDIDGRKYTPQEISAIYIQNMKKYAEDYLGEKVTEAVITVPAYFNDAQRTATKEAGEIAGLKVLRIINEPTSAALAYGLDKSNKDMNIAVFDSGQGTFDISILNLGGGVFEVLSTNGNTHLGGDDFDQVIVDWLIDEFKKDEGGDLSKDPMAVQRLKEAAEKAKIELSNATSTEINLPYIMPVDGTPKHLVKTLTRAKFEQLSSDLFDKHRIPCEHALKDAGLNPSDIDEVILVGGTTRIPKIQELVKEIFGKEPSKSVNPDEAVAIGAAIQGAILGGEKSVGDIVLLDVTPLNIGVETVGGVMTTMIESNTTIPCDKEETFTTYQDNQTAITVNVLQGNRPMAKDNKSLGQFNLEGIMPAKRGVPQINLKISINASGIITVSATDKATGKAQSIRIEGSSSLSKEEIERMKADAEKYAEADKKAKEEADTINKGESLIFAQEKMIKEQEANLSSDEKSQLEGFIGQMKDAVKAKDIAKINELESSINALWQQISQRVYSQQGQAQQTQPGGQETQSEASDNVQEAEVQDADFEEVS